MPKLTMMLFSRFTQRSLFSTSVLFSGQGSQHNGMARDVLEKSSAAKLLFNRASKLLGYDLADICTASQCDILHNTDICQPAIFVTCAATLAYLQESSHLEISLKIASAKYCCGLSLGEYTALYFAGAISFDDCVRLTQLRGKLMRSACDMTRSGMGTIIGLDAISLDEICKSTSTECGELVLISNYLTKNTNSVSGSLLSLEKLYTNIAKTFPRAKIKPLNVSGAFHHPDIMFPALGPLSSALQSVMWKQPSRQVKSNYKGLVYGNSDEIPSILMNQLISPVEWWRCVENNNDDDDDDVIIIGTKSIPLDRHIKVLSW